jgi:hypothetical protein
MRSLPKAHTNSVPLAINVTVRTIRTLPAGLSRRRAANYGRISAYFTPCSDLVIVMSCLQAHCLS